MCSERIFTLGFFIISAVNFLVILVFYILFVIIGVYASDIFGSGLNEAGLVAGIFIIGVLVGRLVMGGVIESLGQRSSLLLSVGFFCVATALYFLEYTSDFLIIVRFIHGFALGLAATAISTVAALVIPVSRKAEGISYFSLSFALASAIGPFIGFLIVGEWLYVNIFILCFMLSVFAFFMCFFMPGSLFVSGASGKAKNKPINGRFFESKAFPISFIALLIGVCYSSVLAFLNAYAKDVELLGAASLFFMVYSVVVLVSRPFSGRLLDQRGAGLVMYPCFLFFSAGLFVLGAASEGWMILLAAALIGLGFGNMQSSTQAIAVKSVNVSRIGAATSTFFVFFDAGMGFGPFLLGFIIPVLGYRGLFFTVGGLAVFCALIYFLQCRGNLYQTSLPCR